MTGVPALGEAQYSNSLTCRMKNMKGDQKGVKAWGLLTITFSHEEHGEKKLVREGYDLSKDGEFFYINPKMAEIDGHNYYLAISGRLDLEVNKTYTLDREGGLVSGHLEFDNVDNDRNASGTLRLNTAMPFARGEFDIYEEGVLSAKGEFEFLEVKG
jgi:hypothetical protein